MFSGGKWKVVAVDSHFFSNGMKVLWGNENFLIAWFCFHVFLFVSFSLLLEVFEGNYPHFEVSRLANAYDIEMSLVSYIRTPNLGGS